MNDAISRRNMVVVCRLGDFWVDESQSSNIRSLLDADKKGMIELQGNFISLSSIDGLLMPDQYDDLNKRRRGAWQCKYGHWHERNNECAHSSIYFNNTKSIGGA